MKPGKVKTVDWVDPTPNGLVIPVAKMNRMVIPNMKLGLSKFLSTAKNTVPQQQDNNPIVNNTTNPNPIIATSKEVKETIVDNIEEFKQNKLLMSKSSPSIVQSKLTEVNPNPPITTNKIIKENKPNPPSDPPVKAKVIEKRPFPPSNAPVKKSIFSNNSIEEKSSNLDNKSSMSNVISTNKPFEEDKKDKKKTGGKVMEFNIVERTDSIVQESKWDKNKSTEDKFDEEDEEFSNYVNNYDDESKTLESFAADGSKADAMMIDGYVVDIQQLRVAPETTMKNLSFDPFSSAQSSNSTDLSKMSDHDRAIWLEVFGTDQIEEEDSVETGYVEDCSLFIIIWQVLDDFFGHVECDNILSGKAEDKTNATNPLGRQDGLDTFDDERLVLDAARQCSNDAQYQFLLRGITTAEKALGIQRLLNKEDKDGNLQEYDLCKTQLFSSVVYPAVCPALNNSQWSLVGLLIMEAICKRRDLITGINDSSNKEWDQKLNMVFASLLGGGKKASKVLRDSELTKLRDFWDEYAYRY
jgi:hypothetical protein